MSKVLTTSSSVKCSHQGTVQTSSNAVLTVNGAPVLVSGTLAGKSVSACTVVDSSSTSKCKTVASLTNPGDATKLTAGGVKVVLDTVAGATDSVPPGTISVQAQQTKLTAI